MALPANQERTDRNFYWWQGSWDDGSCTGFNRVVLGLGDHTVYFRIGATPLEKYGAELDLTGNPPELVHYGTLRVCGFIPVKNAYDRTAIATLQKP